jgi:hypothetical protein
LTSLWRARQRDGWQWDSQRHLIWYDTIFKVTVWVTELEKIIVHRTLNPQPTSDVVGCNVYSDGSVAAIDTWNPSGTMNNVLDKDQVISYC